MSVISVQSFLSAAIARQVKPATLGSAASAADVPSVPVTSGADDAASLSSFSQQSLDLSSYTGASASVAQLGSVLQVTSGGLEDIQALLQQLQRLAGQPAAGVEVSSATLADLNSQFQQILAQISRIISRTTFNGVSVLDGSFSGQQLTSSVPVANSQPPVVELPDVSLPTLFGEGQPNLLTLEAAAKAFTQVGNAKDQVSKASADVKTAQGQAEFAAASLQTAIANIDASKAVITNADLAGAFESILGQVLSAQPAEAAQVQSTNLSPALLSLLQE